MNNQQPKFHPYFHKFLIYFAMWAFALFAVLYGFRNIHHALENDPSYKIFILLTGFLLIVLAAFIIKVRFDLAAFRPAAPKELLGICLAGAALVLFRFLIDELSAEDSYGNPVIEAVIFICWGIALYRYYNDRKYLFEK